MPLKTLAAQPCLPALTLLLSLNLNPNWLRIQVHTGAYVAVGGGHGTLEELQ